MDAESIKMRVQDKNKSAAVLLNSIMKASRYYKKSYSKKWLLPS